MGLPQDVIGIDEGSFFPDIVEFCEEQANSGKVVIVASLDGTFQRKEFGSILQLVPLAEEVSKLTAVCTLCAAPASFSRRIGSETGPLHARHRCSTILTGSVRGLCSRRSHRRG